MKAYADRTPYKGKNAVVIVTYPPKFLPCDCKDGKSTEHQFQREYFVSTVYVCCECGREKKIGK